MPNTAPPRGSTWMRDNLSWLKDLPIKEILAIPGVRNAGMDKFTASNYDEGDADEAVSHLQTIYWQLNYGARWFDIRPILKDNEFYCGYGARDADGQWMCQVGTTLADAIADVNEFTEENKEFIVLRFTGVVDFHTGETVPLEKQEELLTSLFDGLDHSYQAKGYEDALENKLDKYVGTDNCVLVVTRAGDIEDTISDDLYRKINLGLVDYDPPIVRCTTSRYSTGIEVILSIGALASLQFKSDLAQRIFDDSETHNTVDKADSVLLATYKALPQVLTCWTGGLKRERQGLVFQVDSIDNDKVMNMCLAACRVNWRTAFGSMHHTVVVYAGQLIKSNEVNKKFFEIANKRNRVKITNEMFGVPDPWEGGEKSFCVYVSTARGKDGEEKAIFWKGRAGEEDGSLDFGTEITSVSAAREIESTSPTIRELAEVDYRTAYAVLLITREADGELRLDGKMMDFASVLNEPGNWSVLVRYRSQSDGQTKERKFISDVSYHTNWDINNIRFEGKYQSDPTTYRAFYEALDEKKPLRITGRLFYSGFPGQENEGTLTVKKGRRGENDISFRVGQDLTLP